jgi:2-polyprenyl-3-methyl-5-hydroxy-6-metoxy-1,4-benzoquinol methylase
MKTISNHDNIQAWSAYSREMIEAIGDEGDAARRYILNPVLFALVGDIAGRAILDAGCGTGYLCRLFAKQGVQVTGVEPAASLFGYAVECEQTEPLGIDYIQEDLSLFTPDHVAFDIVVANMVFMDIPDYQSAIQHCINALKPGGHFIFSLLHPCFDEVDRPDFEKGYSTKGYIRVDEYLHKFMVQQIVGYYIHRPLSAYLNLVIDAGCTIRQVIEPTLTPEGMAVLGEQNRNLHIPNFIVISARKEVCW